MLSINHPIIKTNRMGSIHIMRNDVDEKLSSRELVRDDKRNHQRHFLFQQLLMKKLIHKMFFLFTGSG